MSTVAAQRMGYAPFPNQCFDPDMDSLVDFNAIPSPGPASSSSQMPPSSVASTMASPATTIMPLDQAEDHQTPAKPSHEYDLFKQQTGLPSGSVPGISMSQSMGSNYAQPFSNSGIGFDDGWGSGLGDMDMDMGNNMPAFFFPQGENSQNEDFVDPSAIQEQPQQVRFFPGMHQQQAALAKAQAQAQQQRQQQMLQQQQQQREQQHRVHHVQRKSAQFTDARTEETIARVVNQIRANSTLSSNGSDCGSNPLPHIIKMKKDEEDMDEDERLLASEEGKKLSSKERRQLRNKVSARAFRSRRKEYISQLEGEVATKTNENTELRMQNRALMEENARSRAFIERLLRHQAFGPFLDELSRDPALTEPAKPASAPQQPAPQMIKQSSQNNSQMGMSMIPEQQPNMSFDYSFNGGFNFNQPQVFAVLEIPEGPANPFDTEILSGKGSSGASPVEAITEIKPDYPVIERFEAEKPAEAVAEAEEVDDGNPDFALYYNSPAPSTAAPSERIFGDIAPEKAFARIEVVVAQETPAQLQQRLERTVAKFDAVYERMQSMMLGSHVGRKTLATTAPLVPAVASISAAVRCLQTAPNPLLLRARCLRVSRPAPSTACRLNSTSHTDVTAIGALRELLGKLTPQPQEIDHGAVSESNKAPFEEQLRAPPGFKQTLVRRSPTLERNRPAYIIYSNEPCYDRPFTTDQIFTAYGPYSRTYDKRISKYLNEDYSQRSMKAYIQVLTTPTADTPGTTLLLHFDNKRYLSGSLGEGTQRAMNQFGTRMLKTQEMFITGRSEWCNTGGLMGMMLTLSDILAAHNLDKKERGLDATPKVLSMFGPPNLNHTIAACRRFVFRKGMPINAVDIKDEAVKKDENGDPIPLFVDENIKVWSMSITPTDAERPERPLTTSTSRKRSYDEVNGPEPAANAPEEESPEAKIARYEQMTRGVVNEMFNSNWRLDALSEKPLSEVKLPATIFIRNAQTKSIDKYTGPVPNPENPDLRVLVREPWPAVKTLALPPTKPAPQAVSYIIRTHSQRGKFMIQKVIEHKVPKGRLWSKLQAGESVQNELGETITSDMVLEPPRRGRGVAIIDLPAPSYVEPMIQREEWTREEIMNGVDAFVWILGPGVAANPALKKFMADRAHLKHIISSVDVLPNRISFDSASNGTMRLRAVDEKRYSIPHYDDETVPQERFVPYNSQKEELSDHVTPAERGLILQLEPKFEMQDKNIMKRCNPQNVMEGFPEEVLSLAKSVKESIQNSSEQFEKWRRKTPMPEAEVIALGTGSALPSKYRNVSATLVRVPGYGSYLLDAGENTIGQLQRVFKPAELAEVLRELRVIWMSHMHADHILGIVGVIKAWYEVVHGAQPTTETVFEAMTAIKENPALAAEKKRLAVISDINMVNWLAEYAAVEDFGYSRLWPLAITANLAKHDVAATLRLQHPPSFFPYDTVTPAIEIPKELYPNLFGLQGVQAVFVNHCHGARAVSLTWPDETRAEEVSEDEEPKPFKVSYSGDCRPCADFARIGRHSTLLVHEATFEDGLEGNAIAKKHSTTSEALAIGARMRARMTLLTHFSQRYQKLPVMEREEAPAAAPTAAEDDKMDIVDDDVDMDAIREEDDIVVPEQQNDEAVPEQDDSVPLENPEGPPKPVSTPLLKTEESGEALATRIKSRSDMRVGVASDYMRVKLGEFAELEKFVPALQALLAEEAKLEGEDEEAEDEVAAAEVHGVGKKDKGDKGENKKKEKKEKLKGEKKEKQKQKEKQKGEAQQQQGEQSQKQKKQKGEQQQEQQQQKQEQLEDEAEVDDFYTSKS